MGFFFFFTEQCRAPDINVIFQKIHPASHMSNQIYTNMFRLQTLREVFSVCTFQLAQWYRQVLSFTSSMMDRQSHEKTEGGGESETNGTAATVTVTSNTKAVTTVANNNITASVVIAMTTTDSTTPPNSQALPTSLDTAPTESQAVQVREGTGRAPEGTMSMCVLKSK